MKDIIWSRMPYEMERPMTLIPQPYTGPGGEPFAVEITTAEGKITFPYTSEEEAWDARDEAIYAGFQARVLGAPCRGVAVVPEPEHKLDIVD